MKITDPLSVTQSRGALNDRITNPIQACLTRYKTLICENALFALLLRTYRYEDSWQCWEHNQWDC